MNGSKSYQDGIWEAAQFLVMSQANAKCASELIQLTGITENEAIKLQQKNIEDGCVLEALKEQDTWR